MNKKTSIFTILSLAFLASCSSGEKNEQKAVEHPSSDKEIAAELDKVEKNEAQKVFYALPSPFEVSSLLKASGIEFEEGILNPIDNLSKYSTTATKALNLGVYGADVSFTSIFEKTQHTMLYLSCIKQLADDLGISTAFGQETMQRLEAGKESKDTLQHIVAEAYAMANGYLKENARSSSSSLILAGGWIEGVHIATSMLDPASPNEDLIELVADQRFSIENLISLLELNKDDENIAAILVELKELNTLYSEINNEKSHEVSTTKTEEGTMVFGGGESVSVSPELLVKITEKVNQIRTQIIE